MAHLYLLIGALLLLCVPLQADEQVIRIGTSSFACRVNAAQTKGQVGKLRGSRFRPLTRSLLKVELLKQKEKFKKLRSQGAKADRLRFDARGQDNYSSLENKYGRIFRSALTINETIQGIAACRSAKFTEIENLENLLVPETKQVWDPTINYQPSAVNPNESAADAFAYDATNYTISERTVHGVNLVVAVHRSLSSLNTSFTTKDFSEIILFQLHKAIHINGGFGVDTFVFKVRGIGDGSGFSLCRGGVSIGSDFYEQHGTGQAHEPFHSWNGAIYEPTPDGSNNLYQLTTLVKEEWTVYYTYLMHAFSIAPYAYEDAMEYFYNQYLQHRGTEDYDLSYADLAVQASQFGTGDSIYRQMMNSRGVLIAYWLDNDLKRFNLTLDNVISHLYLEYGLQSRTYAMQDVEAILTALTGQSYSEFFNTYVYANGDLTVLFGETTQFLLRKPNLNFSALRDSLLTAQ